MCDVSSLFMILMANHNVIKQFGVFVVFMLILVQWGCCKNIDCDVNHCKSLFSNIFKDFFKKGTHRLCGSTDDTIECVDKCLRIFLPDFDFVNSKTSIASEVCSYEFQYDLNHHWNCASGHFHRLLSCLSKSGSMTTADISNETLKLLSCKKYLEALNCPYEILECEEYAIEIIRKLFSKVFKASMDLACYWISSYDAYDLPVTYNLNNSYLSTSACLDELPVVAGNCFTQYLNNFDTNEIHQCRDTCENLNAETCLPSSLMNDFYMPVLSFGKHFCDKDSAVDSKVQMQEPSKASAISYNSEIVSDVYSTNSIANPTDKSDDLVPSDEAEWSDVLSFHSSGVETSTLNYKPNTKEIEHDQVLSDIHLSNNFSPHTTLAFSEVHTEINSLSFGYVADNATENSRASRLDYFQCLVTSCIVLLFL